MKRFILLFTLCLPLFLMAQNIVDNGSFENVDPQAGCNNSFCQSAFSSGNLGDNWICYSSNPFVILSNATLPNIPSFPAPDGNKFVGMTVGASPTTGRSAIAYRNMTPCLDRTYTVSFSVRAFRGNVSYTIAATDVDPAVLSTCDNMPSLFTDITDDDATLVVANGYVDVDDGWVDVTVSNVDFNFPFSSTIDVYEHLVIFPTFDPLNSDPQGLPSFLLFDDLKIVAEPFPCEESVLDLVACPTQGDLGAVTISCPGIAEYVWELPFPGAASITNGIGSTGIIWAQPGTYVLKMKNANGCEDERTYVIEEVCDPCPTPANPFCISGRGGVTLNWANTGADSYIVSIRLNDGDCGCPGASGLPFSLPPTPNNFIPLDANLATSCFSYTVIPVCDDVQGEASAPACYGGDNNDCLSFFSEAIAPSTDGVNPPIIAPNPSKRHINIRWETAPGLRTALHLYALDGRLLKTLQPIVSDDGIVRTTRNLGEELENGIYIIQFRSNQGNYQQKIVLTR